MRGKIARRNPNPNRPMLTLLFLCSLARIRRSRAAQSSPTGRSRRINRAAYASMALAAGRRRAWSRAVLRNLRRRDGTQPRPVATGGAAPFAGKKLKGAARRRQNRRSDAAAGGNQEAELRRLVPGGRRIDFCDLLEETGSYVQHLKAQVLLMQRIADYCMMP